MNTKNIQYPNYQIVEKGQFFIKRKSILGWNYIRTIKGEIYHFEFLRLLTSFFSGILSLAITFTLFYSWFNYQNLNLIILSINLILIAICISMWFWNKVSFESFKDAKNYIIELESEKENHKNEKLLKKERKEKIKNAKTVIHQI